MSYTNMSAEYICFNVPANISQFGLQVMFREQKIAECMGKEKENELSNFMENNFSKIIYEMIRKTSDPDDVRSYYDWVTTNSYICYNNINIDEIFEPRYHKQSLIYALHRLTNNKLSVKLLTELSNICPDSFVRKGKYELLFCLICKSCKFSEGAGDICYNAMPIEIKAGVHPIFSLKYQLKTAIISAIKNSGIVCDVSNYSLYYKRRAKGRNLFKKLQEILGEDGDYKTLNKNLQDAFSYSLTGSVKENLLFENTVFVSKDYVISEDAEAFERFIFDYCTRAIFLNAKNYKRLLVIAEDNKSFYCIKTDCKSYEEFKEVNQESLEKINYRLPAITKGAKQSAMGIELHT